MDVRRPPNQNSNITAAAIQPEVVLDVREELQYDELNDLCVQLPGKEGGAAVWNLIKDHIAFFAVLDLQDPGKAWIRFPFNAPHLREGQPSSKAQFWDVMSYLMFSVDVYQFLSGRPLKRTIQVVDDVHVADGGPACTVFTIRYQCEKCSFESSCRAKCYKRNTGRRGLIEIYFSETYQAVHECESLRVLCETSASTHHEDVERAPPYLTSHDALVTANLSHFVVRSLFMDRFVSSRHFRDIRDFEDQKLALAAMTEAELGISVNPERAHKGFLAAHAANSFVPVMIWLLFPLMLVFVVLFCSFAGAILMADALFRIPMEQDAAKAAQEYYEGEGAIKTQAFIANISSNGYHEMFTMIKTAFDSQEWRSQVYRIDYTYQNPTFPSNDGSLLNEIIRQEPSCNDEEPPRQWITKHVYTSTRPTSDTFTVLVMPNDPQSSYPEYLLDPQIHPEFGHLTCSCCGCSCGLTQERNQRVAQSMWNLGFQWILFHQAIWLLVILVIVGNMGNEITGVLIAGLTFICLDLGLLFLIGWLFLTNVKRKFFKLSPFESHVEKWLLQVRAQAENLAGVLKFWIRCFFLGLVLGTITFLAQLISW